MRNAVFAIAALAIALLVSIAGVVMQHPALTLEQLQHKCELLQPFGSNIERIKACKGILTRPDLSPEYRGALASQLCHALSIAGNWKKALKICALGNDPYPQMANYVSMGIAHYNLGDVYAALQDLDKAAELSPPLGPKPK